MKLKSPTKKLKKQNMNSPNIPFSVLLIMLCFCPVFSPRTITTMSDYTTLVYKTCANKTLTNNNNNPSFDSSSKTLLTLFQFLVSQSLTSNFYETIVAIDDFPAISGFYQCRGDLAPTDCQTCVKLLPDFATSLCENSIACRVQLSGCYLQYESDEIEFLGPELRYKRCSEPESTNDNSNVVMGGAFSYVENGILNGDNDGFYSFKNDAMYVLAQCDGGLAHCDCGGCVSSAMEIALNECPSSTFGDVYMDSCFLSFEFLSYGVPSNLHPEKRRRENKTGRSVAIVLGGAAALCFGFIFLIFIKSFSKKSDDD